MISDILTDMQYLFEEECRQNVQADSLGSSPVSA